MIKSERQLKAAKEKVALLTESLTRRGNPRVNPVFQKSGKLQVQAMIKEIEAEIRRYEELKERGIAALRISSPTDILLLPIEFRIAKHLTQEEFADLVGIPLRQICRYELSEYSSINGENLKKILEKISSKITVVGQVSETQNRG